MKKFFLITALLAFIGAANSQSKKNITLENIVYGEFSQSSVPQFRSMLDGEFYTSTDKSRTMIVKYSYKTGLPVDTLFNVENAKECPFKQFDNYILSEDEKKIMLYNETEYIYRRTFKAKYYTFEIKRNLVKPLSEGKQMAAVFSPNGRNVAFVRDNNIFLKKLDYGTESAVTTDGKYNNIINGVPDWVYEEEFSMNSAMVWSPDNLTLAYIKFDESNVKEYSMQMFEGKFPVIKENELYPGYYSYKYPVSGEANSKVSVHTFNMDTKVTKKMNLLVEEEDYIPRIKFTKDQSKLAVMTFNRHQSKISLHFANPASGVSKIILQDENKAYVNPDNMDCIEFYPDFFTFVSEKSGFRHLYQYSLTGNQLRQVTKGNWDLTDYYGYEPLTKSFYFQAAVESPLEREIYKVDSKGVQTKLTSDKGTNSAHFSNNFKYFQNYFSSINSPLLVTLKDIKGKTIRTLEENKALKATIEKYDFPTKEFFKFTTSNGTELNGYIMKPSNFDSKKKYPVLMTQYSGPGSQSVLNRWEINWNQFLTSKGYIVACVDGRGTGARGAEFERLTYCQIGLLESEDQIEGAKYLGSLPYIDSKRIAIWGWSFGGYNTLMSLTGGDVFKVGMAVAPVTDWKYYDSVYTERYMRTPKENFEGYKITSAVERAKNLKGKLLIICGSADDNVHPQNTLEFTEALVQNDIQFDMHIYTNRNHSIYGGKTTHHLYTRLYNFLEQNL
ncbi:MAG: S9 family peptidase [Bacteroidales bacterium]|nr:S9 family peptidase [Bacteroidales bacterium]